jgi:hypothetical protein
MDETLIISTFGFVALCISKFIREQFLKINRLTFIRNYSELAGFKNIYFKNRSKILITYLMLFLGLSAFNFRYGIYQRGMQSNIVLPYHLNSLIEFMFLIGFGLISSHILFFESLKNKPIPFLAFILTGIENLLSSISILSRGMIFNLSSLTYGLFQSQIKRKEVKLLPWILVSLSIILLFTFSLKITSEIRIEKYNIDLQAKSSVEKIENSPIYLIYNRWVGIEELSMVINKKELNFNLWLNSLSEDGSKKGPSFFDSNFTKDRYANIDWSRNNFITTPGIIAFFFYPGSIFFLFCGLTLFFIFCSLIELCVFYFGRGNLILCSFIGYVMAFRLAHFGYAPLNSYKLFGCIFASLLIIDISYKIASKFK